MSGNNGDHICTAGERFDKIEGKLDKLIELQVASVENRRILNDHETRLRVVEKFQASNAMLARWGERGVWAIIVGLISAWFKWGAK